MTVKRSDQQDDTNLKSEHSPHSANLLGNESEVNSLKENVEIQVNSINEDLLSLSKRLKRIESQLEKNDSELLNN